MAEPLSGKTRSGRSFMEIIAEDNPNDLAVLQLEIDIPTLIQRALDTPDEEVDMPVTSEPLDTAPLNTSPLETSVPLPNGSNKRKLSAEAEAELPDTDQPPKKQQSANNRRRAKVRARNRDTNGHPRGTGRAFEKHVLNTTPIQTDLQSENLPIADGGWVGVNSAYYGAKVRRDVEDLKAKGFSHVQWKGKVPVSVVDKDGRVLLTAAGMPNDETYSRDCKTMSNRMLQMGESIEWDAGEMNSPRGKFPSASYGWSYGKGQHEPKRLAQRRDVMEEFVGRHDVQRVAAFQSASFALWYPKSYGEFRRRNSELKTKIPEYDGNIKGSVYSCCTANFGPNTWTYVHTDAKNAPGACCAITAGGPFDCTKGGQLIVWDLKLVFDFPPGSTILLPSALFRHSNIPVQKGDKRVSFTQYTAGGIHRWLEYGGRTEEEYKQQDSEGYNKMLEMRPTRWRQVLNYFSTIDELKAGIIV